MPPLLDRKTTGRRLMGARLGLTREADRRQAGASSPTYGWVTGGMLLGHDEPLAASRFARPLVAPTLAFVLGRDLAGPATLTDVLVATDGVFLALDVTDAEVPPGGDAGGAEGEDGVAVLTGPCVRPPGELVDLSLLGCVLRLDGDVVATAAGAASLGHPAAAVAWLVNRLDGGDDAGARNLTAGMVVFSGGLTEPVPLAPGRTVTAEADGLGALSLSADPR